MAVSVAGEENRGMSLVIFSSFFQERDKDGREGSSHCPFKRGRSSSLGYLHCISVQLVWLRPPQASSVHSAAFPGMVVIRLPPAPFSEEEPSAVAQGPLLLRVSTEMGALVST